MKTNITLFISILLLSSSCKNDLEYQWTCGELLVDERDGQTYRTKLICGDCWMIENLRFGECIGEDRTLDDDGLIEHYCAIGCLGRNPCQIGGFYTWYEATNFEKDTLQGICPAYWKLPSTSDFELLTGLKKNGSDCDSQCFLLGEYVDEFLILFQFKPYAIWQKNIGINYDSQVLGTVAGKKRYSVENRIISSNNEWPSISRRRSRT